MKIYLSKNDKKEKETQPDLYLKQIATGGEFVEIGALWKAKSGKGYSGNINLDKVKFLKEEFEADKALNKDKKYDTSGNTAKPIVNNLSPEDTAFIQQARQAHDTQSEYNSFTADDVPF